jgi:DNA-binding NtrC family response regulator
VTEGAAIRIGDGEVVMGRDEGEGVLAFVDDTLVSRKHASLCIEGGPRQVRITDLKSKNGIFVNGRAVQTIVLGDGDLIRLGESFFVLRWLERAEEAASDLSGRAPAVIRMRALVDRVDSKSHRVLLLGPVGGLLDDVVDGVHRRLNPEGQKVYLKCATASRERLQEALAGTATVVLFDVDEAATDLVDALNEHAGLAPILATTARDVEAMAQLGTFSSALYQGFDHRIQVPPLRERREDLLGLMVAALGDGSPPLSTELIETLLIYPWDGDMMELIEIATELRVLGSGLDALVTELVSPRLRGSRHAGRVSEDPHTEVDIRRPVPSRPDLEGLLAIHDDDVDAVAEALGRSRMQVMAWVRQHGLDEGGQ